MHRALTEQGAAVLVAIVPAPPAALRRFRRELGVTSALLLADPTWSTYAAYGLRRGTFREIWLSLATWLTYARLLARGRRPHRPEQDVRQLGGDAVIDPRGVLRWLYASRHPADRPAAGEVVRQVQAAR
ncbi:MAG TPA: AhpC/TSA family protein [Methylomirabilota bacterium]|nr:AhpC/TSA family protein [Methylomirabilota bacterium]